MSNKQECVRCGEPTENRILIETPMCTDCILDDPDQLNPIPNAEAKLDLIEHKVKYYERVFAQIIDCKYEADKIMCFIERTLGKSAKEIRRQYKTEEELYAPMPDDIRKGKQPKSTSGHYDVGAEEEGL